MSSTILTSPFARVALRTLGMAPLNREFKLCGSLEHVERMLLVDSGELSDLIFFTPVIEEILLRWPQISLEVMAEESFTPFLRKITGLAGLIVYRREHLKPRSTNYFRLLKEIRNRSYDTVVLMGEQVDPPRDLIAYASQAPLRIGAFQPEREALLNCMVRWRGKGRYQMELAREMTGILGLRYDPLGWRLKMHSEEKRAARQLIHFRKPIGDQILIGVDLGTGKQGHRLAKNNIIYLLNHLVETLQAKVMVFHLNQTKEDIQKFRRDLKSGSLEMPEQDLRHSMAMIAECDLFVSGNTDLFHVAVAQGVAAIGLFTESDGARWEPRGRNNVAILRGRPGDSMPLQDLNELTKRILHAEPS